jgi:raffinose/stachyose/melibiose transport system permease protein
MAANPTITNLDYVQTQTVRRAQSNRWVSWMILLFLAVLLLIMLFPIILITVNSFKTEIEYYADGPFALPQSFSLETIQSAWERTDYTTKLLNSFFISTSVALLAMAISVINAYALVMGKMKAKAALLIFFLMAITLPNESLIYPLYYFFKLIRLYDTKLSIILITATIHSAYGTYLLTSVLSTFNVEVIEAAMIDGCNKVQLLLRIVVPLNRPTLSLMFVFFFIWTWNDFFLPLVFLISNDNQTVPLAMALARNETGKVITTQSATALLGIVPCIIFFLLFQRTLARGTMAGSVK